MEIGIAALITAIGVGIGLGIRLGGMNSDIKHLQDDVKWLRDTIATPVIQKVIQDGFAAHYASYKITEAGKEKLPSDFKKELLEELTKTKEFKKRVKKDDSVENIISFTYSKIGRARLLEAAEASGIEMEVLTVVSALYLLEEYKKESNKARTRGVTKFKENAESGTK